MNYLWPQARSLSVFENRLDGWRRWGRKNSIKLPLKNPPHGSKKKASSDLVWKGFSLVPVERRMDGVRKFLSVAGRLKRIRKWENFQNRKVFFFGEHKKEKKNWKFEINNNKMGIYPDPRNIRGEKDNVKQQTFHSPTLKNIYNIWRLFFPS